MKHKPRLGQNFLIDDAARHNIAAALGDISHRTLIEIGPGHGAITDILAPRAATLIAIELDPTLAAELTLRYASHPNIRILNADILKTDLATLLPPPESETEAIPTADVLGNLPYYITSDILLHLFVAARSGLLARAVLMMQREVADRVAAPPGTSDFGMLSATAQMHARITNLFTLPPSAFSPPPEVHSTVLRFDFAPRFTELDVQPDAFTAFLRSAFAQKRKTLHNNLRHAGHSPAHIAAAWPSTIPPQARAESLPLESLAALHRALLQTHLS